ncbi:MAG TPA: ribosome biogenesis GTPase Der [Anaerolineae bacterium]|nr:ribosome biogenesis GTPase Der [Anaerolineae bacterium]
MPTRRTRRRPRNVDQGASVAGLPVVAIVGRPNVGKSTLFNRIVGQRQAIVEDRARTTRDRLYGVAEWNGRRYVVIDTGGMEIEPGDAIEERVQEQVRLAIEEADVIVFVVDAAAGETPADQEVAATLRRADAPVIMAMNKADNERLEMQATEFLRLGWDDWYAVSALHGRGSGDLLDAVVRALPEESFDELGRKHREREAEQLADQIEQGILPEADEDEAAAETIGEAWDDDEAPTPRIAIVGRPNVGKSSLLNQLLGEERAIVSDIPGTTRDAIDTALEWQGRAVRLVDTAGLRRRGKIASGPAAERYSALRALKALGRADVCVLVLDAQDGLAAQDAHVAGYVVDEGVGLVIAINKWDLVEKDDKTFEEYVARIRRQAPFLHFAPGVAISALTGQRAGKVLDEALLIAAERRRRIPTAALNKVLAEAVSRHQPPAVKGRRPRFYYATQVTIEPPTFVLFASAAKSVHFSYQRFLENRIREAFDFEGTPLRIIFRERSRVELEPKKRGPKPTPRSKSGRKPTKKSVRKGS